MRKRTQSWITSGVNNAASQKILRDALLNKPEIQIALAKYINSLDLQGQVNKGLINEHQALQLFTKAVQNFQRQVAIEINNCITASNQLDQTDLSNSINMQTALNNPNFLASQQMADAAENIIFAIQLDMESMEQAQQQAMQEQQVNEEQAAQEQQLNILQPTPQPQAEEQLPAHVAETILKGATIAELVKALDEKPATKEAENLLEKAFHHITGMEGSFEKAVEEKLSSDDSLSSIPVPRPPKDQTDR